MVDYRVADISQADFGRREIVLAEAEMPALMALRERYADQQPLKGARILGCIHMTIQTAVLIETLTLLGAEVRWSSCNRFSTQDHAAAAVAVLDVPVYAWKGETEEEYVWCLEQTVLKNGEPWNANMVLDDGGDLTEVLHRKYPQVLEQIHGITEETTTGVLRLQEMLARGDLHVPAIDINASVSKSKNDNRYGCRHGLSDAIKRGTDVLISGKRALVFGYGDVGKGSVRSLAQESAIVRVVEIDPLCAMQACLDGFEVVSPWNDGIDTGRPEDLNVRLLAETDIVVTATGNEYVCTWPIMKHLKPGCIVCNIGHFDTEIEVSALQKHCYWEEIKPQVHKIYRDAAADSQPVLTSRDYIILLSEGRLVNLGNATGHPSRVMDGSFANQVLAQMRLFEQGFAHLNDPKERQERISVQCMPRELDEEVAQYMVEGFGGIVSEMTDKQYRYLGLTKGKARKPENYRY
ncbi:MAG: adenosylhomocysteinase [Gammaproteobacteria bacterium]